MVLGRLITLVLICIITKSADAYTLDDVIVEYWAGNGSNEAVVVIDFGVKSFAFGYRWDSGPKYGKDLMNAVAAAGPLDYNDSGGFLNTISYGSFSNIGQEGHPADWWSYFTSTDGENWAGAGEGFATRVLTDGSWDGWAHQTTGDWPAIHLPTTPFPSDFASKIISYRGSFGVSPYDDPNAVLGRPATCVYDDWDDAIYACSLVSGAYKTDPNGNKLVTTITDGAEIAVGFDHRVADDPGNPYGIDFIVFGNAAFIGYDPHDLDDSWVYPDTDMEQYFLRNPIALIAEPLLVSVAQGPNGPWFTFANGPYGDTAFPTNAFAWDRNTHTWGEPLDFLKPVDPNLTLDDFEDLSVADAIDLYEGSAGGTGFDLRWLDIDDYEALAIDPNTGSRWIQYVRVEHLPGSSYAGEIDAFSDVAGCGDYKHPYPVGDLNQDCRVDMSDLAVFTNHWLDCTWDCP